LSGAALVYKMRYLIIEKLKEAGAFSFETAVTPEEANLTIPECRWLTYLSGGMVSRIRKTRKGQYYVRTNRHVPSSKLPPALSTSIADQVTSLIETDSPRKLVSLKSS